MFNRVRGEAWFAPLAPCSLDPVPSLWLSSVIFPVPTLVLLTHAHTHIHTQTLRQRAYCYTIQAKTDMCCCILPMSASHRLITLLWHTRPPFFANILLSHSDQWGLTSLPHSTHAGTHRINKIIEIFSTWLGLACWMGGLLGLCSLVARGSKSSGIIWFLFQIWNRYRSD